MMNALARMIWDAIQRWRWTRAERRMVSALRLSQERRLQDQAVARWLRRHFTDRESIIIANRLEGRG